MTIPSIQDELAAIHAKKEAALKAAAAAVATDARRRADLDKAKARCLAECAEVTAALAATEDPDEREALIRIEERTHASHADELERAYLVFSGQRQGDSNPATPGATTPIDAAVVVTSEDPE